MTEAKEIIEKLKGCDKCGAILFSARSICKRCEELEERGVDAEMWCGCGATKIVTVLPEYREYSFICDECSKATIEKENEEAKIRGEQKIVEEIERQKAQRKAYIERSIPKMFIDADIKNVDADLSKTDILILGDFGTGKTYAAYALARYRYENQEIESFRVERAFKMMMEIKASFSTDSFSAVFEDYAETGLLIIDEWGKNTGTEFESAVLFEIINIRYENRRPTGIIINAKAKNELLELIRPDILDRFRGGIVEINGRSRR